MLKSVVTVCAVRSKNEEFYFLSTQCFDVILCGSRNKQRLFPVTALTDWIFGAFAKLRKATISFFMSVSLSIRQSVRMEHLVSHWADFHEILYLSFFLTSVKTFFSLISDKDNGYFTRIRVYIYYPISPISS